MASVNRLCVGHLVNEAWRPGASYLAHICSNSSANLKHAVFCNRYSGEISGERQNIYSREFSQSVRQMLSRRLSSSVGAYIDNMLTEYLWKSFLEKFRPGIIHAQDGKQTIQWLPFLEKTELPLVVTFHGSDINSATFNVEHHRGLRRVFDRADHLHFVSKALMRHAISIGAPPEKSSVIYLGTPEAKPTEYSNRTHDCVFGIAANLVACKGHEVLLNAFKLVSKRLRNPELHIWGDGPLKSRLHWLTEELGLSGRVVFHGHIPHSDVQHMMRTGTDIILQPSRRDDQGSEEGLPLSICEASAAGIPCIASDCGGISELITHNVTGCLVPQGHVEQLADSMLNLALNPDERRRLGFAALQKVQTRFSAREQMSVIANLYIDLCEKRTAA